MLKQYFTDGLVQLAIVLSLLRTDLNTYFNHNYVNYPEVQEIILGPTAAYTQTNFHNIYNTYYGSHEIHRKNVDIDAIYTSSVIRDLRSFRHISQVINIPTYLLVSGSSNIALETGLSHPFLGMGPGPLELGKLAAFRLKLGKSILSICM